MLGAGVTRAASPAPGLVIIINVIVITRVTDIVIRDVSTSIGHRDNTSSIFALFLSAVTNRLIAGDICGGC